MDEFVPLWRSAITAELCWLDTDGTPRALATTPLLDRGVPCVALPYSRAAEAAGLRRAGRAGFVVTDSRSVPDGESGLACTAAVEVVDDTEGDLFAVELLGQELRKYPPSRALADSPLLCRENWWWLPRLVVRLTGSVRTEPLALRTDPARHALLVRPGEDGPRPVTVAVPGADGGNSPDDGAGPGPTVPLRPIGGDRLDGDGTDALVFGHDYSIPDLERWETWALAGRLRDEGLVPDHRQGTPDAGLAPLGLWQRIRAHHRLASRCKRGIMAAEKHR